MADKLKILLVQHELFKWGRAKMWGYVIHLGLEEGLKANNVEFFTLMTPWMPRAKELCAGRTFDQVWINDITHAFEPGGCGGHQLQEKDLEWLASLAPVRLGFVIESLEYTPEEHANNPALSYARAVLEKTGRYMTHILTPDEKDLPFIRNLQAVPASWYVFPIPERFICRNITLPPQLKPVFRGTPYGERGRWLDLPALKDLINNEPSADNLTDLPQWFDNLQILAQKTIASTSFEPALYDQYLQALREIRLQSFALYMDSMAGGSAVVSLPSFGKVYTGATYEGMAAGRPVITYKVVDRPLLQSAFEDGKDILLYPRDDPARLVEHIKHVLRDPEFGQRVATNGRDKLLRFHTTEKRVHEFLHWIATGHEPRYANSDDSDVAEVAQGKAFPVPTYHSSLPENEDAFREDGPVGNEEKRLAGPKSRKRKLRVLLISPPYARFLGQGNCRFPLSFGALGTILSINGHTVGIYDADFDKGLIGKADTYEYTFSNQHRVQTALQDHGHFVWREIESKVRSFNPDVVGITTMTNKYPMAYRIAEISKSVNPDIKVAIGGHHASIFGPKLVQDRNIDFAVIGEGEMTFLELINLLADPRPDFFRIDGLVYKEGGRVVTNGPRALLCNLDVLPIADRDLMINEGFVSENNIMASRGCPFHCSYCGAQVIWKRKVRRRSVHHVVGEIEYLFQRTPSRNVNFWDDSFTSDRPYTAELMAALKKFGGLSFSCITRLDLVDQEILGRLKEGGCAFILFGIESGSDEILQRIDKKMTRAFIRQQTALVNASGIPWLGFFIMGYPGETRDQIQETLGFMKELNPSCAEINIFNPLPGTRIWETLEGQGLVSSDMDFSKHSQSSTENHFLNGSMTQKEFQEIALIMAREFDAHNRSRNGK